jgi:hypothetical protein
MSSISKTAIESKVSDVANAIKTSVHNGCFCPNEIVSTFLCKLDENADRVISAVCKQLKSEDAALYKNACIELQNHYTLRKTMHKELLHGHSAENFYT